MSDVGAGDQEHRGHRPQKQPQTIREPADPVRLVERLARGGADLGQDDEAVVGPLTDRGEEEQVGEAEVGEQVPGRDEALEVVSKDYGDFQYEFVYRDASYVRASFEGLVQSLIAGGALAILVLFVFLGDWRSPWVVGLAIPVSIVFGLVSPENAGATHLHALAAISRLARDEAMLGALLDAPDTEALFALLTNQFLRDAA